MKLNPKVKLLQDWWDEKAREDFYLYRTYIRHGNFLTNWYIRALSAALSEFYTKYKAGLRPILIISCPPQHGKSWGVEDIISWIAGLNPELRLVYASFSEGLGIRCNSAVQRTLMSEKYNRIFPETHINKKNAVTLANTYKRNSTLVEFVNHRGSFRNTTVQGPITGESLDIGFIDDPFKGRKEANSKTTRDGVWNWFTDDFGTRFADDAGYVVTMTRWHIDDLVGRLLKKYKDTPERIVYVKFAAISEKNEKHRKAGQALFPSLKSLKFLLDRKSVMMDASWMSLYQGNPVVQGGNMIKSWWWEWWEALPLMQFTYAVADTAQKTKNWNDYTVFQLWGMGVDGRIYLLDMFFDRVTAPDLRIQAEIHYLRWNGGTYQTPFRGFFVEDKSSGIGLLQEMQKKRYKFFGIPRITDKVERAQNTGPEIKAGKVVLNAAVPHVDRVLSQATEFPNGGFDDAFDCTMNGIEVAYIYPELLNQEIFIS